MRDVRLSVGCRHDGQLRHSIRAADLLAGFVLRVRVIAADLGPLAQAGYLRRRPPGRSAG